MARDLVCGETVDVQFHTPKKLFRGVVYHFCSLECRDQFAASPERFLTAKRTA